MLVVTIWFPLSLLVDLQLIIPVVGCLLKTKETCEMQVQEI